MAFGFRPFQPILPRRTPMVGLGRTRDEEGNPLMRTLNEQVEFDRLEGEDRKRKKKQKHNQAANIVKEVFG